MCTCYMDSFIIWHEWIKKKTFQINSSVSRLTDLKLSSFEIFFFSQFFSTEVNMPSVYIVHDICTADKFYDNQFLRPWVMTWEIGSKKCYSYLQLRWHWSADQWRSTICFRDLVQNRINISWKFHTNWWRGILFLPWSFNYTITTITPCIS